MLSINTSSLPEESLLNRYELPGFHTDCYYTDINGVVTFDQYISSFYTTCLFKLERYILKWAVSKPSTDTDATQLAAGNQESFAAWNVEDRADNQLLMTDFRDRTRSWFMIMPIEVEGITKTRLFFGSAVTPIKNKQTSEQSLGKSFSLLLSFHKCYSVLLLYSAKLKLSKLILK